MISKPTKIRSKAITQSAKGEQCTLRIPGVCNGNTATTVFAHLPGNKGMGTKNHDLFGVYACSDCHSWLDESIAKFLAGQEKPYINPYYEMLRALQETQMKLYEKGIIEVK